MARARFAKAVSQTSQKPERASVREALWFDIKRVDTSDEASLVEWRFGNFASAALLLGATHLILGATLIARHPHLAVELAPSNPLLPLILVLLFDVLAALGLAARDRLELATHTTGRAMCVYTGLTGVLWLVFVATVIRGGDLGDHPVVTMSLCAGVTMAAIVATNSPPLSVVTHSSPPEQLHTSLHCR